MKKINKINKIKTAIKPIKMFFSKVSKKSWFKWLLRIAALSIATSIMFVIIDDNTLWFEGKERLEAGLGLFIITSMSIIMGLYDSLEKTNAELEKEFGPKPKEKSWLDMFYELS